MNLCKVPPQLAIAIRSNIDALVDWPEPCYSSARTRGEHPNDRAQWQDATQA
jgi:hypothetical protein